MLFITCLYLLWKDDRRRFGFIILLVLFGMFFITNQAQALETTLYFGAVEKDLSSGDKKIYEGAGNAGIVKFISGKNISVQYLYSDHVGSTNKTADSLGKTNSTAVYYPYGSRYGNNIISQAMDRLYTSQHLDFSDNLYYYNARYYNSQTSHFLSADKAEGPNRYAYVRNNPVMKNDPSGNSVAMPPSVQAEVNEIKNNFPLQAAGCSNVESCIKLGGANIATLLGFGGFLPNDYKNYVSQKVALDSYYGGMLPGPMTVEMSGAKLVNSSRSGINNFRMVTRAAKDLVENSEATKFVQTGVAAVDRGESAASAVENMFGFLRNQGIEVLMDTPDSSGNFYTSVKNMMRIENGSIIAHPDLIKGLQMGNPKMEKEFLIHSFHEYGALTAENSIAGRSQAGFKTFTSAVDAFLGTYIGGDINKVVDNVVSRGQSEFGISATERLDFFQMLIK